MEIDISNRSRQNIDEKLVRGVITKFVHEYKKTKYELSVVFVGDKKIRNLNKKYRNIDKSTDVLSFSENDKKSFFLGELFLNYLRIKKQAKKYNNTAREELIFILVHGLLHLIGYEDKSDVGSLKMKNLGNKFIKKYNLS